MGGPKDFRSSGQRAGSGHRQRDGHLFQKREPLPIRPEPKVRRAGQAPGPVVMSGHTEAAVSLALEASEAGPGAASFCIFITGSAHAQPSQRVWIFF